MPSKSPAVFQSRLRLVGQVLLYGSVGTASSAVVYLLQDQIRQIHRLQQPVLNNRKRFAAALREHGISDDSIERMRIRTFEQQIKDLERRGLVKLELVEDPPLRTPSHHNGRKYRIIPIPRGQQHSLVQEQRGDDEGLDLPQATMGVATLPTIDSKVISTFSCLRRSAYSNLYYKHGTRTFSSSSSSKMTGNPAQHWCRLHTMERRTKSSLRLSKAYSAAASFLPSTGPSFVTALRSQAPVSEHDTSTVEDPQSSFSIRFVDPYTPLLVRLVSASPGTTEFLHYLTECHELLVENRLGVRGFLSFLYEKHAFVAILEFHEKFPTIIHQADDYAVVFKSAIKILEQTNSVPIKARIIAVIRSSFARLNPPNLQKALHLSNAKGSDEFVRIISNAVILRFPHLIPSFVPYFIENGQSNRIESLFSSILKNPQHPLLDEDFDQISLALTQMARPLSGARLLCVLLETAIAQARFEVVARIHQQILHTPEFFDPAVTGEAQTVLNAYLSLDGEEATSVDPHRMGAFLQKTSPQFKNKAFLQLGQKFVQDSANSEANVMRFLHVICKNLDEPDILLLIRERSTLGTKFASVDILLRQKLVQLLVAAGRSLQEITAIYQSTIQPDRHSPNSLVEFKEAVLQALCSENRFADAAAVAQDIFTSHPEQHRSWRLMCMLMRAFAWNQQPEMVLSALSQLRVEGCLPTGPAPKAKLDFSAVLYALVNTCTPDEVIPCISTCIEEYGFFFGPRAFDALVKSCILEMRSQSCLVALHDVIKMSTAQSFDVGVRPNTITLALISLQVRARHETRDLHGSMIFSLFSKVCQVNERLINPSLTSEVMYGLSLAKSYVERYIYRTRPTLFGQQWKPSTLKRLATVRLELLGAMAQSVAARSTAKTETDESLIMDTFDVELRGSQPQPRDSLELHIEHARTMRGDFIRAQADASSGDIKSVVQDFEKLLQSGSTFSAKHLQIAVRACLQLKDLERAHRFWKVADKRGVDTRQTQLLFLSTQFWADQKLLSKDVRAMVLKWYNSKVSVQPKLLHTILKRAVNKLTVIGSGSSPEAVSLLVEIFNSKWQQEVPFTIYEYTLFLRAYCRTLNFEGITWTLMTIFQKSIPLNAIFIWTLHNESLIMIEQERSRNTSTQFRVAQMESFMQQVQMVCRDRQRHERKALRKFQQQVVNILLHDATHPGVDDMTRASSNIPNETLDTSHSSSKRSSSMAILSARAVLKAEALNKFKKSRYERWLQLHPDSQRNPDALAALPTVMRDTIAQLREHVPEPRIVEDEDRAFPIWTEEDTFMLQKLEQTSKAIQTATGQTPDVEKVLKIMKTRQSSTAQRDSKGENYLETTARTGNNAKRQVRSVAGNVEKNSYEPEHGTGLAETEEIEVVMDLALEDSEQQNIKTNAMAIKTSTIEDSDEMLAKKPDFARDDLGNDSSWENDFIMESAVAMSNQTESQTSLSSEVSALEALIQALKTDPRAGWKRQLQEDLQKPLPVLEKVFDPILPNLSHITSINGHTFRKPFDSSKRKQATFVFPKSLLKGDEKSLFDASPENNSYMDEVLPQLSLSPHPDTSPPEESSFVESPAVEVPAQGSDMDKLVALLDSKLDPKRQLKGSSASRRGSRGGKSGQ
ncbi:hypothetical protein BT63DRAFT_420559 [Microthyrium microscopicum]|uniref:Uncharacterized protein n=1 Tax=Microthyrium microscopicum TaxID=703497 RepID=A0A6A6UWL0_9PEZI|nr:hypothetical protein BT63DRAFT_420559 [Microthyrium microscopicum]